MSEEIKSKKEKDACREERSNTTAMDIVGDGPLGRFVRCRIAVLHIVFLVKTHSVTGSMV